MPNTFLKCNTSETDYCFPPNLLLPQLSISANVTPVFQSLRPKILMLSFTSSTNSICSTLEISRIQPHLIISTQMLISAQSLIPKPICSHCPPSPLVQVLPLPKLCLSGARLHYASSLEGLPQTQYLSECQESRLRVSLVTLSHAQNMSMLSESSAHPHGELLPSKLRDFLLVYPRQILLDSTKAHAKIWDIALLLFLYI